jgi:diguanylate cyclase (GGDEF)-like protein/PAS domain S-box-containing protein
VSVLTVLAFAAAVVSLWFGARRHSGNATRGYRWLSVAALIDCAGVIVSIAMAGSLSSSGGPPSLADVAPLIGLGAMAIGIATLGTPDATISRSGRRERSGGPFSGAVLPGLADGYVMAVALLVIGWVVAFGGEFHRSGERPGTFLLDLLHPLSDLAVLGALLPVLTTAWRRLAVPYLSLVILTFADSVGVGTRVSGGHEGVLQQLALVVAATLLATAPWSANAAARVSRAPRPSGAPEGSPRGLWGAGAPRSSGAPSGSPGGLWGAGAPQESGGVQGGSSPPGVTSAGVATIVAAAAAAIASIVVVSNGLANAPATGLALVIAGGAAVLVLSARILMLVRENGTAMRIWREASKSLRDLADRTSDVVLICDLAGTIKYASPAVAGFGYNPAHLHGQALESFLHPEDRESTVGSARQVLSGGEPASEQNEAGRMACRIRAADGTWRHVEGTVLRYRVPGEPDQLLVTARDVSDEVALRQQVTHLTFHDGLTGLPNRAYVEERARNVLRGTDGSGRRSGVIFLDLDGFTAVNDSIGHGAGDVVLAQAARRLRAAAPAQDTVARWGGDEFAVLIEGASGPQEVAEIAERLVGTVASEPFRVADHQVALTASVGVALADGDTAGLVLRNADVAMARAKDSGGGRVEVYAAHMHADLVRRLELASDLQQAITSGQLNLQYQPIVELATSRVTGAEALVRWWRGDEVVLPRDFLAIAEDTGLIVPLGEWVLRETCAQGVAWRSSAWNVGVSVNVSLRQLNTPGFPAKVGSILAETGLEPSALTVEVNERVLVEDAGQILNHLTELRALGVRLAIDDFGTGYASLAHLRQLPIDIIKIDPSFVAGLGQDETLTLLTRTIVAVGAELGMQVVAEGIEQSRQLDALREMGCGYGQGFLVARPMAAPGVESLIRTAKTDISHAEIASGTI